MADLFFAIMWMGGIASVPRSHSLIDRIFWPYLLGRWAGGLLPEADRG